MKTPTTATVRKEYKTCVTPAGDWVFKEKGSRRVLANFGGDYALCKYYAQRFCHGSNARLAHGHADGKSICFFETFHAMERHWPIPQLDREYYKIHASIPAHHD